MYFKPRSIWYIRNCTWSSLSFCVLTMLFKSAPIKCVTKYLQQKVELSVSSQQYYSNSCINNTYTCWKSASEVAGWKTSSRPITWKCITRIKIYISLCWCDAVSTITISATYIFMNHVLQHTQLSVRSLGMYRRLKRSGQLLYGHLLSIDCIYGRTVKLNKRFATSYFHRNQNHHYIFLWWKMHEKITIF